MKRYLAVFNLMLTTALIYLGVHAFYRFVELKLDRGPDAGRVRKPAAASESRPIPPVSHYKAIPDRNLFKIDVVGTDPPPEKSTAIEDLKQTTLNLKLWGTVIHDDGKAYAVIEDAADKEQNLYRQGDSIQKASVKLILREKIVLNVEGKDEILSIENIEGKAPSRIAPGAPSVSGNVSESLTQRILLKRDQLTEALQDVNTLMKQARIRPHFQDGKPDGLFLTGIRPDSIFKKMGLRNGDILMGVNEEDIRSVDDALRFYRELGAAASSKLQIKRRGKLQTLEYEIQ